VANGLTPLDIAAGREDQEMMTYLIAHGAERGGAK
jgi:ankyrin repeat protein